MHLYNNPSFFHVKKELGNLIKSQHLYIKVDDTSNFANNFNDLRCHYKHGDRWGQG